MTSNTYIVTDRPSFQGDLMVRRIASLPEHLTAAESATGHHVLAHSETGHHHVLASRSADLLIDEANAFIAYLRVLEPCEIQHLRNHDTHAPLALTPGIYEVRRQREHTPEGWRRAQD